MRSNHKIWMLYGAALVFALIAVAMVYSYVQHQIELAQQKTVIKTVKVVEKPKTRSVVVAKRDIYRGEALTIDDVVVLNVPVEATLVKGVVANPQNAVGKIAKQTIYQGEWLLPQKLSDSAVEDAMGGHPSEILSEGQRMFRLSVSAVTGLLGIIRPGDHVDVISTFESTDSRRMISRIILQNIEVLAVSGKFYSKKSGDQAQSKPAETVVVSPKDQTVITLNLTPRQTELMALAMNTGVVQLALRNSTDTALVNTRGVSLKVMEKGKSRPPKLKKRSQRETIQILQGAQIEEVRSR